MNSMEKRLLAREKPIKVGVAGAGEFSMEMITQVSRIKNMEIAIVGDLDVQRARKAFLEAGYSDDDIVIADSITKAMAAMEKGRRVISEDALLMNDLEIDVVCDITGDPNFGAQFGYRAIENGKHVVVVNIESDVVVGSILRRMAEKAGVVYTEGEGDQPSLIKGLYDFADILGLEVTVAGKWTQVIPEPDLPREGKRSDIGYMDGSKNQVEMCCVANMTALVPDVRGLHLPSLKLNEIIPRLCPQSEGGILSQNGVIEAVNCFDPGKGELIEPLLGGGVFIIVKTDNPYAKTVIKGKGFIGSEDGSRALLYRPYHFVGIETPISIMKAVLYNEATGAVLERPVADVIAIAKKDLQPGERLDGIGGKTVRGLADRVENTKGLLPLGLAENVVIKEYVPRGTALSYEMLRAEGSDFIWRLRKLQDALN